MLKIPETTREIPNREFPERKISGYCFLTELVAFILFTLFHLFYELHVPLCQPVRFLLLSLTFQLNSQQSLFSLPAANKKSVHEGIWEMSQ